MSIANPNATATGKIQPSPSKLYPGVADVFSFQDGPMSHLEEDYRDAPVTSS